MILSVASPTNLTLSSLQGPMLLVGPAHCGKSELGLAALKKDKKTAIVGTGTPISDDMKTRIDFLKSHHPAGTHLYEDVSSIADLFKELAMAQYEQILVDSLNQWLSREIVTLSNKYSFDQIRNIITKDFDELMAIIRAMTISGTPHLVMISSELSAGIVPPGEPSRLFRQLNGLLNQRMAADAKSVITVSCGIPVMIKGATS